MERQVFVNHQQWNLYQLCIELLQALARDNSNTATAITTKKHHPKKQRKPSSHQEENQGLEYQLQEQTFKKFKSNKSSPTTAAVEDAQQQREIEEEEEEEQEEQDDEEDREEEKVEVGGHDPVSKLCLILKISTISIDMSRRRSRHNLILDVGDEQIEQESLYGSETTETHNIFETKLPVTMNPEEISSSQETTANISSSRVAAFNSRIASTRQARLATESKMMIIPFLKSSHLQGGTIILKKLNR